MPICIQNSPSAYVGPPLRGYEPIKIWLEVCSYLLKEKNLSKVISRLEYHWRLKANAFDLG